jgi:hypothetical protein
MPQDASSQQSDQRRTQIRRTLRLLAIPLIGVVAALLYYGLYDRFFLPECDSDRAKRTLADILRQLKLEPSRYAPITTVSSGKTDVVCKAILPLPDGGNVAIDYSFYWQRTEANIRYSVTRK